MGIDEIFSSMADIHSVEFEKLSRFLVDKSFEKCMKGFITDYKLQKVMKLNVVNFFLSMLPNLFSKFFDRFDDAKRY